MHNNPHVADVIASGIHDTKNILFEAIGQIEQSCLGPVACENKRALHRAEGAIKKAADRLSKMLAAYKLLRHENPVSMVPVVVSELLEDVTTQVFEQDAVSPVKLTTQIEHEGYWILDRDLISDSVRNMVENALRHAKSAVLVSAKVEDGMLKLTVEDDGDGFQESDVANNDDGRSGLGLFITRRIAGLHQRHDKTGRLDISESSQLGGASVSIELP